jgi:hypothetical protein
MGPNYQSTAEDHDISNIIFYLFRICATFFYVNLLLIVITNTFLSPNLITEIFVRFEIFLNST